MTPNFADLQFWRHKTAPGWAKQLVERADLITIDHVISTRDPGIRRKDLCTGNLMNLLKLRVRTGRRTNPKYTYFSALLEYAASPYTCPDRKKRTALCRKWADRVYKQRNAQKTQAV